MSEEAEIVYMNINQLLEDICKFLKNGMNKEALSPEARRQADHLIRRSKVQLQKISTITSEITKNGYLAMDKPPDKQVIPKEIEPTPVIKEKSFPFGCDTCPFADLSAKDIAPDGKSGYISWKIKFILGIEKQKRIFAAVCKDWLLVYHSEKDSKPTCTFNLRTNRAQQLIMQKHSGNETPFFTLTNIETKYTVQFMAQTHKDMIQWVAKINKWHQPIQQAQPKKLERNLPDPDMLSEIEDQNNLDIEEDEGEIYDSILEDKTHQTEIDDKPVEEEEDEVYVDIDYRPEPPPVAKKSLPVKPTVASIDLTKMQKMPLPPLPPNDRSSDESLASYDDLNVVEHDHILKSEPHDSFSEEEEDIYDEVIANPRQQIEKINNELKNRMLQPKLLKTETPIAKPLIMPKPKAALAKPKIDVKIIKSPSSVKSSTKQILKKARENSLK